MTETQNSQSVRRKHPLAECETCPLYEGSVFVPSYGPDKADVVLVGEAPGLNEEKEGKPFVGASGKLLDTILPTAGIKRNQVFITNTCLCRPRDNANPPAAAVRACSSRLIQEIEARSPKVVVTLGNFATQSILDNNDGITKSRVGPPKTKSILSDGIKVIPTFHPAAALYNSGSFPDIVTDFGKIKGALSGTIETTWTPPDLRIFTKVDESRRVLQELLDSRYDKVSIDIEVGIEKDIDLGRPDHQDLLCVGISHRPNGAIVVGYDPCHDGVVTNLIGKVLENKKIIAQNGKFDLAKLYEHSPQGALEGLYFDTMLAHYCLDERRGTHSLDQLAIEYLGAPDWKAEFRRSFIGKNYADAPRELLYKYNGYDASNTYLLEGVLGDLLEKQNLRSLHDFLVRVSPVLMRMEMNGLGVDLEYNRILGDEIEALVIEHRNYLRQVLEQPTYNPNSWQQVQKAFREQFNKKLKNTRKETIILVQELAARTNNMDLYRFCENHLAFKKEIKAYGTYIEGIRERTVTIDGRDRVYTDFLIHGTVSGRLASRDPNLQNITRGSRLRRQFIPSSPNNVFIQADYRQAELRVVCCLARDAYLREVLSDSTRDIHSEVAERFYGKGFSKEQRVLAKAVVFGLLYGREAYSLAAEHRMSTREAQTYINTFFEVIPHTVKWITELEEQILNGHDLVTPFGRHRRFWLITSKNKESVLKEGRAFLPQSTASDITLEASARLAREGFWDLNRILIHDALVVEVPQSEAEERSTHMKRVMEETAFELMEGYVPFPVDIKVGKNWGELD